jgi:hypothetical protein
MAPIVGPGSSESRPRRRVRRRALTTHEDSPMSDFAFCSIHPGIGIARLGNSPDAYFIGPEAPGHTAESLGGFKDDLGRVKRQVARFRIYGYDAGGKFVRELTAAEADITWTVQLANKKSSWFEFQGAAAEADANSGGPPLPLRNADIQVTVENPMARRALEIDPGPRSISGVNAGGPASRFDTGTFLGMPVPLGEIRTDEAGRLLVFGGFGKSESAIPDNPIVEYANNNRWHDDTADGPVTAKVVLKGGSEVPVRDSSWVIVAPPDFAPPVDNLVTLYDVMYEIAVGRGWIAPPANVSFTRDIYPILQRAAGYQWVNAFALRGHGPGRPGNFTDPFVRSDLADKTDSKKLARHAVFDRIRNPAPPNAAAARAQANLRFMPQLSGDEGYTTEGEPSTWFTVLTSQYAMLERWADGDFDADWPTAALPPPPLFEQIDPADQPAALDRAALEHCVGGPFFPGIEMTYICRDSGLYSGPFRLRAGLAAGDVTKRMAVPWQADFYECQSRWWPSQRPDDVITEQQYQKILDAFAGQAGEDGFDLTNLLFDRTAWARGIGDRVRYQGDALQIVIDNGTQGDNDLAVSWNELGFVVPRVTPNGGTVLVETERAPYAGLKDRDYFYYMLNLDQFPDFLPKARALADAFLADADALLENPTDDEMPFFEYSPEAFTGRLEQIYNDLVDYAAGYDPNSPDIVFKSRQDMIERMLQLAPFNQTDGAWLRNVTQAGPINEIHSLLFSVWMDEAGNGDPALNHANLYTDLLRSVGVYLEDINTLVYADNPDLLDSAFTVPLLELVLSQFSQLYFPELLGMTLNLEWEVVALKPTIQLFERFGMNAQFYRMHVGIDNAVDGHGGKAKRAVEIYLDQVRAESGEVAMQAQWRRIWRGYTAFKYTGTLMQDLADKLRHPPSLIQKVYAMVRRKARYARLNHGTKQIGPNLLNDWFDDVRGLIGSVDEHGAYTSGALVTAGYIVAGDPDNSPFFKLLEFTGPMYKVFDESEIELWKHWTRSIGGPPPPPPPDPGAAMAALIDLMRDRQTGTPGHEISSLAGPDTDHPGAAVTRTVASWFSDAPTTAFMQALANEDNGFVVKGNSGASRFVTQLLSGDHPMANALGAPQPSLGAKTGREVAIAWIDAGCPIPPADHDRAHAPAHAAERNGRVRQLRESAHAAGRRLRRVMLDSPASEFFNQPTERMIGNGAVH